MKTPFTLLLFIFGSLSIQAQMPTENLGHYYPFNNNADDVIFGNDAIVVGNVEPVEDRFGMDNCAYSFDGEWTSVMLMQGCCNYQVTADSSFSVSLWYRYGSENDSDREYLFSKGFSYDDSVSFSIFLFDINTPVIGIDNNQSFIDQSLISWPSDSSWHHIVATFQPSGIKVYFDNQLALENTGIIHNMAADVHFGENFEGHLDDIAFYNKALNTNEIAQLYNAPSSCTTGLNELNLELDINCYPNPTTSLLNIDLKKINASAFEIINAEGKIMETGSINSSMLTIDVNHFAKGLYIIRLSKDENDLGYKSFSVQ